MKSLVLASKVKSLTLSSKPQVLENCSVLGSRTALFFELLKFCRLPEKNFKRCLLLENARKTFLKPFFIWRSPEKKFEDLFFLRTLALVSLFLGLGLEHFCPWPRLGLSSEGLSLASDLFVSLALVSSLVSSTPPLLLTVVIDVCQKLQSHQILRIETFQKTETLIYRNFEYENFEFC